jgi:hypothetical protein
VINKLFDDRKRQCVANAFYDAALLSVLKQQRERIRIASLQGVELTRIALHRNSARPRHVVAMPRAVVFKREVGCAH